MDLLGSVHAHPGAQIPGEQLRSAALPLAGEEAVLEGSEQVGLAGC
jgi:hypothetical protein